MKLIQILFYNSDISESTAFQAVKFQAHSRCIILNLQKNVKGLRKKKVENVGGTM